MYIEKRVISIEPVYSKSYYLKANIKALPDLAKGITPSINATNKLVNADNINKNVLRNIIAIDPTANEWTRSVKDYYNSLMYIIPSGGKNLETGFMYNNEEDSKTFTKKIEDVLKEYAPLLKKYADEEDSKNENLVFNKQKDELFQIEVEKNTIVNGIPKYGVPIHPEEYIVYLYCLYTPYVAKRFKDVDKTVKIKYVMTSEEETKKVEEENFKLQFSADEAYIKVASDEAKMNLVLKVMNKYTPSMSTLDKKKELKRLSELSASSFLRTVNDKQLENKALIEDLVSANIISRIKDSGIYVDANDSSIIIGNTLSEAIAFFNESNTINKAKASELITKYKSLKSKK